MSQPPVVIFVCEHGAAKSILAATYFNRLAEEQNLEWRAIARGTNPDPEISQATVSGLSRDGLTPIIDIPRTLSIDDIQSARHIVTFCELASEYSAATNVEHWEDVPAVSQDYAIARDAILKNIHDLLRRIK